MYLMGNGAEMKIYGPERVYCVHTCPVYVCSVHVYTQVHPWPHVFAPVNKTINSGSPVTSYYYILATSATLRSSLTIVISRQIRIKDFSEIRISGK